MKDVAVFDIPCVFDSIEEVRNKVDDAKFYGLMEDVYKDAGYKLLGYADQGFRVMSTNKNITSLSDFKGQKIRTMENPYHMAFWKSLKANPTPMTFSEVYIGLQQGTIDAQENPYTNIVNSRFYEVQKYVVETGHIYDACPLIISTITWKRLDDNQKKIIKEAAAEAVNWERKEVKKDDDLFREQVKKSGTTVIVLTPEQRAAIDTRGSTVLVSAAAGSGKTRVLTERLMAYLTDAEDPADIDRFLVITYTRAAAAELRSRILDGIYARIASDPENRRLRRQVALCARAEIGTIHSFCADFLRANCAALALAPDFQVTDAERCAALRAAALEHTLERAYTRIDTDKGFRLLADTVGGGRDDARRGELVLSLYHKRQCHARPAQWAQRQVELLALDDVTDAGATPWGRSLLARMRESAEHWCGVLEAQLDIMADEDMEWLMDIYGDSFSATADGLRALAYACNRSWDAAVTALQDVPFPRLGSTRKPPDPDVRDRVKAQRDAARPTPPKSGGAASWISPISST